MKSEELQCALATEKAKLGHSEEQDEELKVLSLLSWRILSYKAFSVQLSAFSFKMCKLLMLSLILLHNCVDHNRRKS